MQIFRHVNVQIQSALVRKEDIAAFKELYVERGIIRNPVFKVVKGFHRRHKRKIYLDINSKGRTDHRRLKSDNAESRHEQEAFLCLKSDDEPYQTDYNGLFFSQCHSEVPLKPPMPADFNLAGTPTPRHLCLPRTTQP